MAQIQPNHPLPGAEEMRSWMDDWVERVLPHLSPEQRVAGMTAEEMVLGLSAEQLPRLRALLNKTEKD